MNNVRAAVLVALAVTGVTCNDLRVGNEHGRIVFNETVHASPAIWRQSQQITINGTDQEIISSVVVTDERPEKDGEAKIVGGGEGQHNVTIELKSPTVFRGFDFHIVAHAVQGTVQHPLTDGQNTLTDNQQTLTNAQHPVVLTKDTDLNTSAKPEAKDIVTNVTPKATEKTGNEGSTTTVLPGEQLRKYRNTQQPDPIAKFVTEKANEGQQSTVSPLVTEVTTGAVKVNGPIVPTTLSKVPEDENQQSHKVVTFATEKFETTSTESNLKINGHIFPVTHPNVHNHGPVSTTLSKESEDKTTTTTLAPEFTTSTEKTQEKVTTHNFDSISKELGQKVIFGIKKH